jgi:hypothetical protein
VYQRVIMNLTDKGFVVFCLRPIGQGERLQYVDGKPESRKPAVSTTEHSYAGAQTLLSVFHCPIILSGTGSGS